MGLQAVWVYCRRDTSLGPVGDRTKISSLRSSVIELFDLVGCRAA